MATRTSLLPLVQRFFETDVVTATRGLETMDEDEALAVLKELPIELAAQAFRHLHVAHAAALLREASPELFRGLVEKLEPQQGAAILLRMPDDLRARFLEQLSGSHKRKLQELFAYPEGSAGRIMTTDFLAFHGQVRVRDAIQRIRALAHRKALSSYTYVIDEDERLAGVINMRDLILASGDATLDSVMRREVFAVNAFLDKEAVAHELAERRYFAAPVIDPEGRLVGIVKSDQLLGSAQEEATEDIQKMFGAGGDERVFSPPLFSLRKRLPWLHVNLVTAFLAAAVVGLFEDVIARVTILAVFLPVVAGQGGNAGAQSLAVVMRGLVMREIPAGRIRRLLGKETLLGLANGVAIGLVTAGVAWLWHGNPWLGVVIGLAMVLNLIAAGFSGAAIPLAMKGLGLDPAQSSSIILTTVTDVVGFFTFLGFAVLFQSKLIA